MYLVGFGAAFALTAALTPAVRRFALARGVVDVPDEERKIHTGTVAYLGGVAIFIGFVVPTLLLVQVSRQLVALLLACLILVVVGVIDDKHGVAAWKKLVWQFVAAGVALGGGIGITAITSPFGGVIDLSWGRTAFQVGGLTLHITPIANLLSMLWMVGLANTVNFLDGLDGLACGMSGIAALVVFALSVGPNVNQPGVALLSVILAGAALGFLPHNWYPARIFMGDSGAYFLGLVLAMLAIYSGAKLATAALVLGFPIVDAIWAAVRRMAKRQSPFKADRLHFHHLLLDAGLSQRQAVITLYSVAAAFGAVALMGGSMAKLVALVMLVVLMATAIAALTLVRRRRYR